MLLETPHHNLPLYAALRIDGISIVLGILVLVALSLLLLCSWCEKGKKRLFADSNGVLPKQRRDVDNTPADNSTSSKSILDNTTRFEGGDDNHVMSHKRKLPQLPDGKRPSVQRRSSQNTANLYESINEIENELPLSNQVPPIPVAECSNLYEEINLALETNVKLDNYTKNAMGTEDDQKLAIEVEDCNEISVQSKDGFEKVVEAKNKHMITVEVEDFSEKVLTTEDGHKKAVEGEDELSVIVEVEDCTISDEHNGSHYSKIGNPKKIVPVDCELGTLTQNTEPGDVAQAIDSLSVSKMETNGESGVKKIPLYAKVNKLRATPKDSENIIQSS
ncbi:uncharacterized protein LOC114665190 isoform X2 [Erpetoichthys calabaricus]|uniref:uncharacterized protein LOC114665190 isoform X2 n=1 Tax=Erpetoichthys calabaricus TaxID=27687 RepID=UPI00109EFB80|nr:uncharacterized protein LOC114665190 isoform X2 [Erpetoichthys calabaricus]